MGSLPLTSSMSHLNHPLLYQANTRVMLHERGVDLGTHATLDDIPDAVLDNIAAGKGFDWIWLLGIWQTGARGRQISRASPALLDHYRHALPDLREEEICGSPFAIRAYDVNEDFGGDGALVRLRERLGRRDLKLLLDFVPNHTALDHPWVARHPEYYVHGTEDDLAREPQNYVRVATGGDRTLILAHGRDPYFDGWTDTLQLNYRHAGLRQAQLDQLAAVAERCDGVRCDMAMLLQPAIFVRTWGDRALPADGSPPVDAPFWPEAIGAIRHARPDFLFVAEVYWNMERELQQAGFDYTYDKRLCDLLREGAAPPVREHLSGEATFQQRCLRFLENQDEPRAAAIFPPHIHKAAAVTTFLAPGIGLIHDGQLEGRKVHASIHLVRRAAEAADLDLSAFYRRLLACLRRPEVRTGQWRLWPCRPAWDGNPTHQQFIVWSWAAGDQRLLGAVNYGGSQGQCYVTLDMRALGGRIFMLNDLLGAARYQRRGDDLTGNGLYLDMPPWGHHVFEIQPT
jgi:hypothetical protein